MADPTYIGARCNIADDGTDANASVTIDVSTLSMSAGDLVVVVVQERYAGISNGEWTVDNTGGQTWHRLAFAGNTTQSAIMWACRFDGTWDANPAFSGVTAICTTAQLMVWRPEAGKTFDIDLSPNTGTFAAGSDPWTKTITGMTTRVAGDVVLAVWGSTDDNTWASLTAGWTVCNAADAAQIRNNAGSDQSLTCAYLIKTSAGATGNVSYNQVDVAGDAGWTIIVAFKQHAAYLGSAPTVDLYVDVENGSDGNALTTTILGNATHGSGGTWSLDGGTTNGYTVENDAERALGGSVVCGGTTYDDTGSTRGVLYAHSFGATNNYYLYTLTSSCAAISNGFLIKTSLTYQTYNGVAFQTLYGIGRTSFACLAIWCDQATYHLFSPHTEIGVAAAGVEVVQNHWYWVTIKYDKANSRMELMVFDAENSLAQVGFAQTYAMGSTENCNAVIIGRTDGNGLEDATYTWIDDLIVDYSGDFPLLPGAAGGPTSYPRAVSGTMVAAAGGLVRKFSGKRKQVGIL